MKEKIGISNRTMGMLRAYAQALDIDVDIIAEQILIDAIVAEEPGLHEDLIDLPTAREFRQETRHEDRE